MNLLNRRTSLILAWLVALGLLLAACGSGSSTSASAPKTAPALSVAGDFVGKTNYVDFIALSSNGRTVTAFTSDGVGAPDPLTFAVWFTGAITHNAIDLTDPHGAHLSATLTPQSARGTVTLPSGKGFTFTAPVLTGTPEVGLFRAEQTFGGVRYLAGWAIMPPSTAVAGQEGNLWSHPRAGAIINEQTEALLVPPMLTMQDIAALRMTVPGLGTFVLTHMCQNTAGGAKTLVVCPGVRGFTPPRAPACLLSGALATACADTVLS